MVIEFLRQFFLYPVDFNPDVRMAQTRDLGNFFLRNIFQEKADDDPIQFG